MEFFYDSFLFTPPPRLPHYKLQVAVVFEDFLCTLSLPGPLACHAVGNGTGLLQSETCFRIFVYTKEGGELFVGSQGIILERHLKQYFPTHDNYLPMETDTLHPHRGAMPLAVG